MATVTAASTAATPSPSLSRKRARGSWPWSGASAGTIASLAGLLILAGLAILAPWVAPGDPLAQDLTLRLKAPSLAHLFGTDQLGRDILSRVMFGARISLLVGVSSVLISGALGTVLGLLAGYYGGWIDMLLSRVADVQQAIPYLTLAIAVVAILGGSLVNVILVLGVTTWVTFERVVRSEVLARRNSELVQAARVIGAGHGRILTRHLLPNVGASIVVLGSLTIANMIILEASLSFLGLGVPPPAASWGRMVFDGMEYVTSAWWLSVFPGLAIALTVLAMNLVGDWLRDLLDPRQRQLR